METMTWRSIIVAATLGLGTGCTLEESTPRAYAGPDLEVDALTTVVIVAEVDDGADPLGVAWTQLAGPPVQMSAVTLPRLEFTAPEVDDDDEVVLLLTVTDAAGAVASDAVRIAIRSRHPSQRARNVILMIGDGMHLEHETAYSRYRHGWDFGAAWHGFPYRNYVTTWDTTAYDRYAYASGVAPYRAAGFDPLIGYAPDRGGALPSPLQATPLLSYFFTYLPRWAGDVPMLPYPDSASTATALATGHKTEDGNLAWLPGDPPDGALETIAERARDEGFAVGVASTVPFSHATPAAFVSHNRTRSAYHQIAEEILHRFQPDVVIGAGHPRSLGTHRFLSQADYDGLVAGVAPPFDAYQFVERVPGVDGGIALAAAAAAAIRDGRRLVGLFGGSDEHNEQWIAADAPGAPAFSRPGVEDPSLAAIATAALEVLAARGDAGFFAVLEGGDIDWAAHERDYAQLVGAVHGFDEAVRAVIAYIERPGDDVDWTNTLLVVTADHATGGLRLARDPAVMLGAGDLPAQEPDPDHPGLPAYPGGEVEWLQPDPGKHTNELVAVHARGAGLARFARYEGTWYPGTRLIDNTQLHQVLARVLGLE
jgi:alkaline phosphatase